MPSVVQPFMLSIIIPVYNTSLSFLENMMTSLNTNRPGSTEIIIVDDGSNATVRSKLEEFSSIYNDVIVIHQRHQGQNQARKQGLKYANGEYVLFCDSDDILIWNKMVGIISILTRRHADAIVFNSEMICESKVRSGYGNSQFTKKECSYDIK